MAISSYTRANVGPYSSPAAKEKGSDWGAKLYASYEKLTFTAAGFTTASAGDIPLITLPPGNVRLFGGLSWVACPVGTATSDLDIGWGAYTNQAGTAVTANEDGIAASLDVGAAPSRRISTTSRSTSTSIARAACRSSAPSTPPTRRPRATSSSRSSTRGCKTWP